MSVAITTDVREVLERVIITDLQVVLPAQLDRKLYEAVNKCLTNIGGKWNRKAKAHVFPSDPSVYIAEIVETGKSRHLQQEKQAYYTPAALAAQILRDHTTLLRGDWVLEPSAGHGALAEAAAAYVDRCTIDTLETDLDTIAVLAGLGYRPVQGDFLQWQACPIYDLVYMNPPFAAGASMRHVQHALHFVKPGGTLLAITSVMDGQRQTALDKEFTCTMRGVGATRYDLPEDAFHAAGTDARTALWVVHLPAPVVDMLEPEILGDGECSPLLMDEGAANEDAPAPQSDPGADLLEPAILSAGEAPPLLMDEEAGHDDTPEPQADPDGPACACGKPAGYQVHGTWCTRAWIVVAVSAQPRYCERCAEKRARYYAMNTPPPRG